MKYFNILLYSCAMISVGILLALLSVGQAPVGFTWIVIIAVSAFALYILVRGLTGFILLGINLQIKKEQKILELMRSIKSEQAVFKVGDQVHVETDNDLLSDYPVLVNDNSGTVVGVNEDKASVLLFSDEIITVAVSKLRHVKTARP